MMKLFTRIFSSLAVTATFSASAFAATPFDTTPLPSFEVNSTYRGKVYNLEERYEWERRQRSRQKTFESLVWAASKTPTSGLQREVSRFLKQIHQ